MNKRVPRAVDQAGGAELVTKRLDLTDRLVTAQLEIGIRQSAQHGTDPQGMGVVCSDEHRG